MVALRPAASRAGAPGRGSRVAELQAGDRGTVAPEGGVTVTRGAVTGDDASWTTGALQFREAPVREVLAELARWYGVPMRLGDERLAARTLTATFAPGDSAAAVLRTVALALGAELSQQGDTAVLRAAGR
jgi:transmembrane sensor